MGVSKLEDEERKREMKKETPEHALKQAVKEYLGLQGWLVETNVQGILCTKGRPDLEATKKFHGLAITIWIETKAPKGKVSDYQRDYIRALRAEGGLVSVCKSFDEFRYDLQEIEKIIRERLAK